MWQTLDPKLLWGRIEKYGNYDRTHITLTKGIIDGVVDKNAANYIASTKRLHYANGLFYVFKCESRCIELKFKYHHSNKGDFYLPRSTIVDLQLLGRVKNTKTWIMLNRMHMTDKFFPDCAEHEYKIRYNLTEQFDEFQLCLPYGSVYYYICINTDKEVKMIEPEKVKIAFLGSSIGSLIGTPACASIPSQLYREMKINTCNLSIPMTNSAIYDDVVDYILNHTDIKWYLLDTMHMNKAAVDRILQCNVKDICVNARVVPAYKFKNVNYTFNFDNPLYYRDHLHLTTFGAYALVQKIISIIKEEI